jgi:hypothetical protein
MDYVVTLDFIVFGDLVTRMEVRQLCTKLSISSSRHHAEADLNEKVNSIYHMLLCVCCPLTMVIASVKIPCAVR